MPKTNHRVTLTATKIRGLKPASKGQRYQVMDSLVPGFGVRVTETGNRTFILRTRYPGSSTPSRRELGGCNELDLTEAREKARRWRALVGQGVDPASEAARLAAENIRRRRITFGTVSEDFIRHKLPAERKGKDVEREIRRDLMPEWGKLAITEILDVDISTLVKRKGRDGKVGARNLLALIKRFFRWATAQPEYGISVSPCANLRATDKE